MKNSSSSFVIPAEDAADAVVVWKLQALGGASANTHNRTPASKAATLSGHSLRKREEEQRAAAIAQAEAIEQRVRDAYAQGVAAGRQEAAQVLQAEFAARQAQIAPIIRQVQHEADMLDARVADQVLQLALAVARQVVRAELQLEPQHFVDLVREGLGQISEQATRITLHVSAADADLVRHDLGDIDNRLNIVEDPAITPGGCRFVTSHGDVDATIEARFDAIRTPLRAATIPTEGSS